MGIPLSEPHPQVPPFYVEHTFTATYDTWGYNTATTSRSSGAAAGQLHSKD